MSVVHITCLCSSIFFYFFLILGTPANVDCVKIVRHSISQTLRANTSQGLAVVLDCEYSHGPEDVKLVVRWFYNDSPEPVYQWIVESDKRYVGELIRANFDMDFQVGHDSFSRYRAIRLRPTGPTGTLPLSLSGNYTCVISSILSQDSRQGHLAIYVPPARFEFNLFADPSPSQVTAKLGASPVLRCLASDVYPRPRLIFAELSSPPTASRSLSRPMVQVVQNESSQLYRTWLEYPLDVDSIQVGSIFECRLELPAANYVRKKRIKLIYPSIYSYVASKGEPDAGRKKGERTLAEGEQRPEGVNWFHTKLLSDSQTQLAKTSAAVDGCRIKSSTLLFHLLLLLLVQLLRV